VLQKEFQKFKIVSIFKGKSKTKTRYGKFVTWCRTRGGKAATTSGVGRAKRVEGRGGENDMMARIVCLTLAGSLWLNCHKVKVTRRD